MLFNTLFLIKDIIIVILLFGLISAVRKVRKLKESLEEEKRKRSLPMITMEVHTGEDYGVFLVNDSYCYARNIKADDLDVVVDYGFKKRITLKFDPVELLKPNEKHKLHYRVFDGEYDTTTSDDRNILNHFPDSPIELHLQYENIEGSPFATTIVSEKDYYIIKEVNIIEE